MRQIYKYKTESLTRICTFIRKIFHKIKECRFDERFESYTKHLTVQSTVF